MNNICQKLKMSYFSLDDIIPIGRESKEQIRLLFNKKTGHLFGPLLDIEQLLVTSCASFGLYDSERKSELIAAVCLNDYPNIPSVPPWDWCTAIGKTYNLSDDVNQISTLWFHLIVWHPNYRLLFMQFFLQAIFQNFRTLGTLLLVVPPGYGRLEFFSNQTPYERLLPTSFGDMKMTNSKFIQTVCVMDRKDYVYNYRIRRAVEEDNDDLVKIINEKAPIIEEFYGEFYIAEMVIHHQENRKIVVGEGSNGRAVGVLSLTESINYDLLNESFELLAFHGLRKPNREDRITELTFLKSDISLQPLQLEDDLAISVDNLQSIHQSNESLKRSDSHSQCEFDEVELEIFQCLSDDDIFDNHSTSNSLCSALMLDDEYQDHFMQFNKMPIGMSEHNRVQTSKNRLDIPMYYGESNAFAIELAAVLTNWEDCLLHLLEASFVCYPQMDYCICSIPSSCHPSYELFKYFTMVTPRKHSTFTHQLYILSKYSFLGAIYVREIEPNDTIELSNLICKVPKSQQVLEQIQLIANCDGIYVGYVLVCEETVVAVAVLRYEEEQDYLDAHYDMNYWTTPEQHKSGSHGVIENLLLCPIFDAHGGFFLRELHRLSDFSILFYRLYPIDATSQRSRPVNNLIDYLVPILPRLLPQYDYYLKDHSDLHSILSKSDVFTTKDEYGWQLQKLLLKHNEPFSLFLSTKNLSNIQRTYINSRIVVVGTSATAIAFLECLVFAQHSNNLFFFTNVTVVSPHGFSFYKLRNQLRDKMFVNNGHLDRYHLYSTSLMTYVNVVPGVMTMIDRRRKLITVNNDSCLVYDYLMLMCGEQFQKPIWNKKKFANNLPANVFIINTDIDAANALIKLKQIFFTNKSVIVVYGHYLEALCCLNCLLEYGTPAEQVIYINPGPDIEDNHEHITSFFNNQLVEEGVFRIIQEIGVQIYNGYKCVDWGIEKNFLVAIKIMSKYKVIEMECDALFYYNQKSVSTKTFLALNKAGLTFDGHLVIDNKFCTNDPFIFAGGTITKYSRKYFADHLSHKYFNGQEIGLDLGRKMKHLILNLSELSVELESEALVKIYKKPVVKHCQLPGGVNYVSVTKPGRGVPLEVAMARNDFGQVYVTGDVNDLNGQGYFWLHLNKYGLVETITCLSKNDVYVRNLISIWGKHETLLNNLGIRFAREDISDLFEFFQEPWACAIYHDRFNNLMEELELLCDIVKLPDGTTLHDAIVQKFQKNSGNEIKDLFDATDYNKLAEDRIVDFIEQNNTHLPMYAHSLWVRMILQGIQKSPLFYPF